MVIRGNRDVRGVIGNRVESVAIFGSSASLPPPLPLYPLCLSTHSAPLTPLTL